MPKMMGKARWWGAWSFNGDDYNAGQRAAEKREWQAEAEQDLRALEEDAAYARHALDERVKQGGNWEKSNEFYASMWADEQVQHAREALRGL